MLVSGGVDFLKDYCFNQGWYIQFPIRSTGLPYISNTNGCYDKCLHEHTIDEFYGSLLGPKFGKVRFTPFLIGFLRGLLGNPKDS